MVFNLSKRREDAIATVILNLIIRSVLNYISYFFLLVVVWLNFIPLLIVATTIFAGLIEDMFIFFAKFIAPVIIKFVDIPTHIQYSSKNGGASFPIMKIFFVMSLVFMAVCEIGKFILRKFFHKKIKSSFQSRLSLSLALTHAIYFLFLIAIIFGKNIDKEDSSFNWFFVFIIVYIINLLALVGHLKLENWIEKMDKYSYKKIQNLSINE